MNHLILAHAIFAILLASGCNADVGFQFGVYNTSGGDLTDVSITFTDGIARPIGVLSDDATKTMLLPGSVPDVADLTWTDAKKVVHKQRLRITPLPPPTAGSFDGNIRNFFFVIQPDGAVKVVGHDPRFTG